MFICRLLFQKAAILCIWQEYFVSLHKVVTLQKGPAALTQLKSPFISIRIVGPIFFKIWEHQARANLLSYPRDAELPSPKYFAKMAPLDATGDQFAILPIQIPPVASFPETAIHEVRIRRNAPKIPTANDSRSLFLKNIPVDSTEPHFRAIFTDLVGAGRFETIAFEDDNKAAVAIDPARALKMAGFARKRKRGDVEDEERAEEEAARLPDIWTRQLHRSSSTAVVLLADDKSVQLVLKAIAKLQKTKKYPVWGQSISGDVQPLGSPWVSSHLRLCRANKKEIQNATHAFFNVFNRKEKEAAELSKRLRNEPDEDGFVTVTRGGKVNPANQFEAEEARRKMVEKADKKKSELTDFYRFQLRERRKQEQAELLKRFEEDKRKVNAMKEKRGKFKPET